MRLFVALELPVWVRGAVGRQAAEVRDELPRARWVAMENLHLTLSFLGEQAETVVGELVGGLAPIFGGYRPMSLSLSRAGCFPLRGGARVLWLSLIGSGRLAELQRQVAEKSAELLGLEPERRPFQPHVTLARCRPPWPPQAVELYQKHFATLPGGEFMVENGTLFESRLGRDGARYRSVQSLPFQGGS